MESRLTLATNGMLAADLTGPPNCRTENSGPEGHGFTTVFEFYDSHVGLSRPVANRVPWFANLASTILPCIAVLCRAVGLQFGLQNLFPAHVKERALNRSRRGWRLILT